MDFLNLISVLTEEVKKSENLIQGEAQRWLASINVGIIIFGAFFILNAFMPATFAIKRTRNTVGINRTMFLLHSTVAFLFTIGSICFLVAMLQALFPAGKPTNNTPMVVSGTATAIILICLNGSCLCGNSFITLTKTKNMNAAAKLGISEADYYREYIAKDLGLSQGGEAQ